MPDAVTPDIDQLMQSASQALAVMDYLHCEQQCEQALDLARQRRLWDAYARVLLPLQEVRRQRRMIAAEGMIRLGSASLEGPARNVLETLKDGGCLVLTHPHSAEDAEALLEIARSKQQHIELLWAEEGGDAERWLLRTFIGQDLKVSVDAPPQAWQDRWFTPQEVLQATGESQAGVNRSSNPADWFMDASESLGDAGLALADEINDLGLRLQLLEDCVMGVPDHELLHQRLAQTARALQMQSSS